MATWVLPKSPRLSGAPEYGAEPLPAADWRLCGSYWWKKMKDDFRTLEQVLRQATAPNGAPQSDLGSDARRVCARHGRAGRGAGSGPTGGRQVGNLPHGRQVGNVPYGTGVGNLASEYRLAACPTGRLPPRAWRRWPLAAAAALVLCVVIGLAVYGRRAGPATAGRSVAAGGPVAAADGRNKAAAGQPPPARTRVPCSGTIRSTNKSSRPGKAWLLPRVSWRTALEPAELVRYQVGQVLQDVEKSKL